MISGPQWLHLVDDEATYSYTGAVQAALLTTYDPPDATLLVEDLLPRWFRLDREMSSEDVTNRLFLAELEEELRRRRGKFAIFSSAAVLGPDSRHWIWSHVARHFVGARGSVVQHAKLWFLHRVDENGAECLDIRISSTNLTRSAIREQLQAGFRCLAPLGRTRSTTATRSWGVLIPFLEGLGAHAGPAGIAAVKPWLQLLGRCRCPADVTLIASVPGTHRGSDWGARALGGALRLPARSEVDILVPTVGLWSKEQIRSWARAVGTLPKRVRLVWVPKGHAWAKQWKLPGAAVGTLKESGITFLTLGDGAEDKRKRLHHSFHAYDERWPHAKVYWFERGASPQVLVTSANWSPSAWGIPTGRNQFRIKNFELGVLLPTQKRPLRTLKEMTLPPATGDVGHDNEGAAPWAYATFDGRSLVVQIFKGELAPDEIVAIDADDHRVKLKVRWKPARGLLQAVLKRVWKRGPSVVVLVLGKAEHWLSVQDLRNPNAVREMPLSRPPGITEDELKRLRAALLEERYGGTLIDENEPSSGGNSRGGDPKPNGDSGVGNYSVWLLDEARRILAVVDHWACALEKMQSNDLRDSIEHDGRQLLRLWRDEINENGSRKGALIVACDELSARLRRRA